MCQSDYLRPLSPEEREGEGERAVRTDHSLEYIARTLILAHSAYFLSIPNCRDAVIKLLPLAFSFSFSFSSCPHPLSCNFHRLHPRPRERDDSPLAAKNKEHFSLSKTTQERMRREHSVVDLKCNRAITPINSLILMRVTFHLDCLPPVGRLMKCTCRRGRKESCTLQM